MEQSAWIKLVGDDTLPDVGVPVLVFENPNRQYNAPMNPTMRVAVMSASLVFNYTDGLERHHRALNVTHWMSLPELPTL